MLDETSEVDYYQTLNVEADCSQDAIKKAFRSGSEQYHTDKHAGQNEEQQKLMNSRFQTLNEAYQVLSDPRKRVAYDKFGRIGVDRFLPLVPATFEGERLAYGLDILAARQELARRQSHSTATSDLEIGLDVQPLSQRLFGEDVPSAAPETETEIEDSTETFPEEREAEHEGKPVVDTSIMEDADEVTKTTETKLKYVGASNVPFIPGVVEVDGKKKVVLIPQSEEVQKKLASRLGMRVDDTKTTPLISISRPPKTPLLRALRLSHSFQQPIGSNTIKFFASTRALQPGTGILVGADLFAPLSACAQAGGKVVLGPGGFKCSLSYDRQLSPYWGWKERIHVGCGNRELDVTPIKAGWYTGMTFSLRRKLSPSLKGELSLTVNSRRYGTSVPQEIEVPSTALQLTVLNHSETSASGTMWQGMLNLGYQTLSFAIVRHLENFDPRLSNLLDARATEERVTTSGTRLSWTTIVWRALIPIIAVTRSAFSKALEFSPLPTGRRTSRKHKNPVKEREPDTLKPGYTESISSSTEEDDSDDESEASDDENPAVIPTSTTAPLSALATEAPKKPRLSATQNGMLDIFHARVVYNTEWWLRITKYHQFGLRVSTSFPLFGVPWFAVLELSPGYRHMQHTIRIPLLCSTSTRVTVTALWSLVPWTACRLLSRFVLCPLLMLYRLRKAARHRTENKEHMWASYHHALQEQTALLGSTPEPLIVGDLACVGQLEIIKAEYGVLQRTSFFKKQGFKPEIFRDSKESELPPSPPLSIDVCRSLQQKIENNSIFLAKGSKSALAGFYDPEPTGYIRKQLRIEYRFRNNYHSVTYDDMDIVEIPLEEHAKRR